MSTRKRRKISFFMFPFVLYYKTNIKYFFRIDIQLNINTRGNCENSKLCENTPPFGRRVSTQFLVFPISTRVDITVYQHGKCFIFVKYKPSGYTIQISFYLLFKNSLIIHEENTKKNHKRVVSLYVDKDFPSFT